MLRLAGVVYPFVSLFVIVATGNHYYVDAVAGAAVALVATLAARVLTERSRRPNVETLSVATTKRIPIRKSTCVGTSGWRSGSLAE